MTLGPALLALAWLERRSWTDNNPLIVFGRTPLFYFVVHFYAIHLLVKIMALLRYGRMALPFLFQPVPSMGGARELYPPDFGYELWVVYVVWGAIVIAMYPLCRWFAKVKTAHRNWWLSYL